ncbi:MAG TPA: response regulator [Steroidobacteraceae bacterium]|nr:response regulator [Steroidobacteraceae bacterium]
MKDERVNILLVDDQPARLVTYEVILADLGENLVTAESGREALQLLMTMEFAAILLDVSMPGMDGFETATLIHQHPRFEKTPIIFVTAVHVTDLDRLHGYRIGAVDYVYVPVVPEILRGKVQVLVELHRKRRELQAANEALARANEQLAAEKRSELEKLNRHLMDVNTELAAANETLKGEVRERLRAQAAVQEADRRKEEFLAVLSHELRNPLAAIDAAVRLMAQRNLIDPQLSWAREVLSRQTAHLTRLVDDLLDIARVNRGNIMLRREPVQVAGLLAHAVESVRPLLESRRHDLRVTTPQWPLRVHGDPVRLTQVIANLLSNAAQYSDEGSRIELQADVLPGDGGGTPEVVIRVRDSGIGISTQDLGRIFELFRQLEQPDRRQGGLGVGLALARRLVELHGGSIEAQSEGAGKGSEFIVRIPELCSGQAEVAASPAPGHGTTAALRLLIVDDNVDSARTLAMLLELSGHEVRVAHSGAAALQAVAERRFDAVLLDIGMPEMNGYEVAQRLRTEQKFNGRLIALTGYGRDYDREVAHCAGFDHHLVKPVDYSMLEQILRGASIARLETEERDERPRSAALEPSGIGA